MANSYTANGMTASPFGAYTPGQNLSPEIMAALALQAQQHGLDPFTGTYNGGPGDNSWQMSQGGWDYRPVSGGYVTAPTGASHGGIGRANLFDQSGKFLNDFNIDNFDHTDWQEYLIMAGLAAGGAAMAAGAGAAGAGVAEGGGAAATTGAGFVGEGAASGIAGWDGALAAAPSWSAAGAGAGAGDFLGEAPWSPTPGSTPMEFGGTSTMGSNAAPGTFNAAQDSQMANAAIEAGGGDALSGYTAAGVPSVGGSGFGDFLSNPKNLAGLATTALGAASGAGGAGGGAGGAGGAGGTLDPRLEPYLYGQGGLLPQTQAMLASQMPQSQMQASQMAQVGTGLLNQPIAGNGVGQVQMGSVNEASNPYLRGVADDLQRRTSDLLAKNNLAIKGNAVASGGLGGSRMGVAQGVAAGQAADSLQGQIAGLYGQAYDQDSNRNLQKYGVDTNFWTNQRQQDLTGAQLGGGLLGQSQQQAWNPLNSASGIYKPYSGLSSASGNSGTNWAGIGGGLLSGAALAGKMGLWS